MFDEDVVSAVHAEMLLEGSTWTLVDLASTNGTWLNGERAERRRLTHGDLLRFGREGPELRVELRAEADPAGAAVPPLEPDLPAELPPSAAAVVKGWGDPSVLAAGDRGRIPTAPEFPISQARRGPGSKTIRAAVDQAISVSNRRLRIILGLTLVASLGGMAVLGGLLLKQQQKLLEQEREGQAFLEALEFDREQATQGRAETQRLRADLATREADVHEIQKEMTRLASQGRGRQTAKVQALQRQLTAMERELGQLRSDTEVFKSVAKQAERSLVLIYASLQARDPKGNLRPLGGFGTGFVVSETGLIVTNKHVIQPWKFHRLAMKVRQEQLELDYATHRMVAWPAGTRFAMRGINRLDFSRAFDSSQRTLKIERTTPDRWIYVPEDGESRTAGTLRVHANDGSDDLMILRARRGTFQPLSLRDLKLFPLEKLDPAMVLGFPRGPSMLELGVAEPSPALGAIQKVEETIAVNASVIEGNSGGPLLDRQGRVIGVASRRAAETETLGTCISVDHVRELLQGLE